LRGREQRDSNDEHPESQGALDSEFAVAEEDEDDDETPGAAEGAEETNQWKKRDYSMDTRDDQKNSFEPEPNVWGSDKS